MSVLDQEVWSIQFIRKTPIETQFYLQCTNLTNLTNLTKHGDSIISILSTICTKNTCIQSNCNFKNESSCFPLHWIWKIRLFSPAPSNHQLNFRPNRLTRLTCRQGASRLDSCTSCIMMPFVKVDLLPEFRLILRSGGQYLIITIQLE
jgi:hypothetical protein